MLDIGDIRELSDSLNVFHKGQQLFQLKTVSELTFHRKSHRFSAKVYTHKLFKTEVEISEDGEIDAYMCTCKDFDDLLGACVHVVATLLAIHQDGENLIGIPNTKPPVLSESKTHLLSFFNTLNRLNDPPSESTLNPQNQPKEILSLVPTLFVNNFSTRTGLERYLEFHIATDRTYVLKSIPTLIDSILNNKIVHFGKYLTFNPARSVFNERSQALISMLKSVFIDERQSLPKNVYYGYSQYSSSLFRNERRFLLTESQFNKYIDIVTAHTDVPFNMVVNGEKIPSVRIIEGNPPLHLKVDFIENGLKTELLDVSEGLFALDLERQFYLYKGHLYRVTPQFGQYWEPLLRCFNENTSTEFVIPTHAMDQYITTVLPELEKIAQVHMDDTITSHYTRSELIKEVYFDRHGDGLSAKVLFKYAEHTINPTDERPITPFPKGQQLTISQPLYIDDKKLIREFPSEARLLHLFEHYGWKAQQKEYTLDTEDLAYLFLREGLSQVIEQADVFYTDDFRTIQPIQQGKISCGVKVDLGSRLLEMRFEHTDFMRDEIMAVLASYQAKKHYHRLKSGQFLDLDKSAFAHIADLATQLNFSLSEISAEKITLPLNRALYVDSLFREQPQLELSRNSSFKRLVQDISEPQDLEFSVPTCLEGTLRSYQTTGYKWLRTLDTYGFGGILADDMGLGKTLQVISLFLAAKTEGAGPSLVVAPTSLVYNWQEEVQKFAPQLIVHVLCGSKATRQEGFEAITTADVVVTTYGMIKRDLEMYTETVFRYCILDEAQHIKNPSTQNAKAVKQIKAKGYFALTGTPIENTLTELWSIFDFIMPGYLLNHHQFMKKFETPIVKNSDKGRLKELGRHIKPFILRRMKRDVLLELPDKIESKLSSEMSSEQRKIYTAYLLKAQKEFQEELALNGFDKSQIKILSILTRLRQICCHPGTFLEDYRGGSGKIDQLMEIVTEALEGNHRLLIFSQFTSMLAIIKEHFDHAKINYSYLDGQTSAMERMNRVQAFNHGQNDVFLISLKAGGTGLNLTGADMVVHFDPWWNPAVEDQATDRAHRIGQTKAVQVFKLIAKDTIEEKIFLLQQKKKELINSVIEPGESFISKLTEQEIRALFQ